MQRRGLVVHSYGNFGNSYVQLGVLDLSYIKSFSDLCIGDMDDEDSIQEIWKDCFLCCRHHYLKITKKTKDTFGFLIYSKEKRHAIQNISKEKIWEFVFKLYFNDVSIPFLG